VTTVRRSPAPVQVSAQAPAQVRVDAERPDVDVAVLGGGCSGLSLAFRLAGTAVSVRIVEPRESYVADRVWSFWRTRPDPFEDCVIGRWARWSASARGRHIVRSSQTLSYESVSSGLFYRKCVARIDAVPNVRLDLGRRVRSVRPGPTGFRVETDAGGFCARHVVDTRPLETSPSYAQTFIGYEIETAGDVFDAETVELMSFDTPFGDHIPFTYVLPFARDRALIEATVFGPPGLCPDDVRMRLDSAVRTRLRHKEHRVLREEAGSIPMDGTHSRPAERGMLPLGVRGGAARPSTGYAFARIQETADMAADALLSGSPAAAADLDGPVTRHMDRLFLKVLQRHPRRAPDLFADMFEHAPPDRLERFLSGSTTLADRLATVAALPPGLFIKTALGR